MSTTTVMQLALLTSFTLVALVLSIRSAWRGFLLCIITLPLEATLVAEVGFTLRLSYVALFVTAVSLLVNTRQTVFSRSPLDAFVVTFVLVAGLSIGMTTIYPPPEVALSTTMGYRGSEFRPLIQWLVLLLFVAGYFMAVHFCSNTRGLRITLLGYLIVASIVAVYGIYQFFAVYYQLPFLDITYATGKQTYAASYRDLTAFRSHATFHEPMAFGHYLLSVIPLSLVLYAHQHSTSRNPLPEGKVRIPIYFLQVAALLVALYFTSSRGAWFGFLLGVVAIVFLSGKKVATPALILLAVALTASIGFVLPYWVSGELLSSGFRGGFDALLASDRWQYIAFTIGFWANRPTIWLFGTGIGNFPLHSAAHFGFSTLSGPYSLPLQILAETGLIGLAAFTILIVRAYSILLHALQLSRGTVWEAYFVGYIASLTALFGQHLFYADRLPLYVWILMGCSIGTVKAMESSRASGEFAFVEPVPAARFVPGQVVHKPRLLEMLIDLVLITVAYLGAHLLRFQGIISPDLAGRVALSLPLVVGIKMVVFYLMGVYREDRRLRGLLDLMTLVKATAVASLLVVGAFFIWTRLAGYSRAALAIDWVLTLILLSGFRASAPILQNFLATRRTKG